MGTQFVVLTMNQFQCEGEEMVYMTKLMGQTNSGNGGEIILAMESVQFFDEKLYLRVYENDDLKMEK
jgi:hypothetical protein